jgi:hypothetical protein
MPGLVGEHSHAARRINDGAQRYRHSTRTATFQHRINVSGDFGVASQVLLRAQ